MTNQQLGKRIGPRTPTAFLGWLLMAAWLVPAETLGREILSYARVNEDATITVRNQVVQLYGIHIPPTERDCRTEIQPVRCAPRAVLALEFKVRGFVRCEQLAELPNRRWLGRCSVDDVDLSEYLLSRGWAMALPEAPFSFHALERIARHRGLGVWGTPADVITR